MKFKLSEAFLDGYKNKKPPFGFNGLGELVYNRCVEVDTPVLCADLVWRKAGVLTEGDALIAFSEQLDPKTKERYYTRAHVTHHHVESALCLGIELENGRTLYCTPEHQWLVYTSANDATLKWLKTVDFEKHPTVALPLLMEPWDSTQSYDTGYLSGAYDGEGSLDRVQAVTFTQLENTVLARVESLLTNHDIEYTKRPKKRYASYDSYSFKSNNVCYDLVIQKIAHILKFFGVCNPIRLKEKYLTRLFQSKKAMRFDKKVRVKRVFSAGERKVAVISTSAKTHFTAGFPSHNTYSRLKPDGKNEKWWETVQRVVEGTFTMQKRWISDQGLSWNAWKGQQSAHELFDRIFNMKFLPPGRGLWAMGSPICEDKGLFAALNNCGFASTAFIKEELSKPFCFLMDMSMVGVGVGFDLRGAKQILIKGCNKESTITYQIADTREGWVESLKYLLESHFLGNPRVIFDYTLVRPAGQPIKGFGGISSGPEPLKEMHENIRKSLEKNRGEPITLTTIVDVMNHIGKCVVAGNVRRTAEIVFGDPNDTEYLDLKDYKKNPHREAYGWTSNNSVLCPVGIDYTEAAARTAVNGEPGYFWLENAQKYSRMNNGPDNKDSRSTGCNPCAEQSLEHYELCNLVETFPNRHESLEDYLVTLKYAYLYAKTVTLGKTHWPETNRVMLRNRRIGCSMSGIAQFISDKGLHMLKHWCEEGYKTLQNYDKIYSDWLAIPVSIKMTSIKPSGTVSLLAGATPGMHYPESRFYIRRVRLSKHSDLIEPLKAAGYHIEPCVGSEDTTSVVEIPVDVGQKVRTLDQLSMWEQLALAAFLQKYWSDNQVSVTIKFKPEEAEQIKPALDYFQYQLKGVSFLPYKTKHKVYPQMPYEEIDEKTYGKMCTKLDNVKFGRITNEAAEVERFCTNDSCELPKK